MADFKTHVTFSSVCGCGYAAAGTAAGFELTTALVAGGLCGVAGMLPDVDSDSGVPRREALGFAAAIVPMLLIDRFKQFDLAHDQMILLGAAIYFGVRFMAADVIGKWSVHRGMWHSIPAILIFAGLAFLITGSNDIFVRYYKAVAVALGSMSHLVLDEIYSVDTRGVLPKFKKSFGTAVKFFGKKGWPNTICYGMLAVVAVVILMEPAVISRLELRNPEFANQVREVKNRVAQFQGSANARLGDRVIAATEGVMPETRGAPPAPPSTQSPALSAGWPAPNRQPYTEQPYFGPPSGGATGGFTPNRGDAMRAPASYPPVRVPQGYYPR